MVIAYSVSEYYCGKQFNYIKCNFITDSGISMVLGFDEDGAYTNNLEHNISEREFAKIYKILQAVWLLTSTNDIIRESRVYRDGL